MNKPTMYEFLNAYMQNVYDSMVKGECAVYNLTIECRDCPFKTACATASEAGCERTCAEFIKSQLADGKCFE